MTTEKQRRAFISYSRVNMEFAAKLAKELRAAGYPIWFDQLDIPTGARWDDEVEKALRECSIFMVILTPATITSENVKDEIGYAIDRGKRILPVLLEDCDVPLRLRRFQYVDFTTKSFEEGFESAKGLLGDLIDEASIPVIVKPPLAEPAVESKPAPVQAKPLPVVEAKPAPAQAKPLLPVSAEKKAAPKGIFTGIAIGIGAVILLCIAVYALTKNSRQTISSTAPIQTTGAPARYINGLNILIGAEAAKQSELKSISMLAGELYTDAQISDFGGIIPINLTKPEPLKIGSGWCTTTQQILDENMRSLKITFKINNREIPNTYIAFYEYTDKDGLPCTYKFIVVNEWKVGEYRISSTGYTATQINDGSDNYGPGTLFEDTYIVTVP